MSAKSATKSAWKSPRTLATLLDDMPDPAQPFVTYYDLVTGERIELSTTSMLNWVAKTANFLVDDLDAALGTRVRMTLPSHWETYVLLLAAWRVGCVITDEPADLLITGPDPDLQAAQSQAAQSQAADPAKIALSLRPMAAPFPSPPADHLDFNAEVLGHSDHFLALDPPDAHSLAFQRAGQSVTHQQALAAPHTRSSQPGTRVLVTPADLETDITTLLSAARCQGSLVLVVGATAEQCKSIADEEQATLI